MIRAQLGRGYARSVREPYTVGRLPNDAAPDPVANPVRAARFAVLHRQTYPEPACVVIHRVLIS